MCKIWKWWNDVKCRHRTCTETIPLFRISEENESSHPRIQSCSKRFKKLFKRLALSSSETYTVNLVNLNTMDAFLDTTCWHVLDTVACATSQHDTITVNSNYGKKKESESLGMELDDNFFDSWKTSRASSCKPGFFFEDFHQQFRFRCLHPFGLGLALVTRGLPLTASIIFHDFKRKKHAKTPWRQGTVRMGWRSRNDDWSIFWSLLRFRIIATSEQAFCFPAASGIALGSLRCLKKGPGTSGSTWRSVIAGPVTYVTSL